MSTSFLTSYWLGRRSLSRQAGELTPTDLISVLKMFVETEYNDDSDALNQLSAVVAVTKHQMRSITQYETLEVSLLLVVCV